MDLRLARQRYSEHRSRASARGIEWEFTFEEWCEIWAPHWERRGPQRDGRVMCRTQDQGAYSPDNVRIDTPKGNAAEAGLMRRCSRVQWRAAGDDARGIIEGGFKSYGSRFPRPDAALEIAEEEYEWIPGE